MMFLREKYAKYICLIAIVLMQLSVSNADPISCVQCGVAAKCSTNLGETAQACPTDANTYTKCFTQIDTSGNIVRGCKTAEEATACTAENNCVLTDAGKNNQLICKKCDGTDEKCSQTDMTANDLKYNQICAEGVKKCIKKVANKLVVRSCASDSDITQCTDANTCETCDSVNCNTGIFPTKRINCYQCTGSSCTDVATNSLVSKPCPNYEDKDQCYTKGKSETDMTRGCKSDTKDNQCTATGEGCVFCSSDNCNNLKYKYDQVLKCHQCSSNDATNDCFKQQTGQEFKNCEKQILYSDTEYCYTQLTSDTINRGCLHDNADLTLDNCKDGDSATCNKCNNANGCNSKAQTIEFTCIVCRSDLNEKCWDDADTLTGQKCRTSTSSAAEGCFHGIWNGVAIRGCMVDASKQNQQVCKDKSNLQCNDCYKKDCNNLKSGAAQHGVQFALLLIVLTTLWNFK
ncbi:prestalk protein [Calliphora vicina]|uniref:prestalk protein n=1 Tax=Calliphora vicina TaxID=7373 RepID=UPI00325A5C0F